MTSTATQPELSSIRIVQDIQISAPAQIVFDAILDQSGQGFRSLDGSSLSAKLEPWPGGRWYRDLGNNTGHLWGHIQVIKPPTLLEIIGPMMMSYPVVSHIQYRLTEKSGITTLALIHRAFGEIAPEHREGVNKGWANILAQIKDRAQK